MGWMSNVISLPTKTIKITRLYCDCGVPLSYWIDDADNSYGLCQRCDLHEPEEIIVNHSENDK
jgi:hypothetical protein|tara:strand:- start:810 stop:998 length:189 start_codon:yes stop_codon:yes gene_type:complete